MKKKPKKFKPADVEVEVVPLDVTPRGATTPCTAKQHQLDSKQTCKICGRSYK